MQHFAERLKYEYSNDNCKEKIHRISLVNSISLLFIYKGRRHGFSHDSSHHVSTFNGEWRGHFHELIFYEIKKLAN
jgi:hypothetical protein